MKKRLIILVALALALGLCAYAAEHLTGGANGTKASSPASVVETASEVGSIEDYYPRLNSSYGGYRVPTPDGSLRLTGLYRNPASPSMLVVRTDFTYDADGRLAETETYFDAAASYRYLKLFFGWDPDSCLLEQDIQGRISKVTINPGLEDEYSTVFTYPGDGAAHSVFHTRTKYADGSVNERDVYVRDYLARNEVSKTQSELSPDSEFEYDEDGLVIKAKMADMTDLNGKQMSKVYFYQYAADKNGFLEYVFGPGRIAFNRQGYLTEYPLEPAGGCYYEYYYAPAA